jgi:hypothetical protein
MERPAKYQLNRGIGQPLEFRGLKAQYLGHVVALSVGLFVLMGMMHMMGMPPFGIVFSVFGLGGWALRRLYRLSNTYGQHGLMKKRARRDLPDALVSSSRQLFIQLYSDGTGDRF